MRLEPTQSVPLHWLCLLTLLPMSASATSVSPGISRVPTPHVHSTPGEKARRKNLRNSESFCVIKKLILQQLGGKSDYLL